MDYYTLDRQQVSDLLKVSTRTLDRYVAKNVFSTQRKKGKLFFHAKEVEDFLHTNNTESIDNSRHIQSTRLQEIQNQFASEFSRNFTAEPVSQPMAKEVKLELPSQKEMQLEMEKNMYKQLYEKMQELHASQLDRLQQASYRIGELEHKMQNTVPLLEAKNKQEEIQVELQQKAKFIQQLQQEQEELEGKMQTAQFFKVLYFTTTFLAIIGASLFFALS